ncbi:hypothetical protein A33Q_1968 [Indibacter alkaliphilus LW1]|uniref:Uncharacterized protein n=1 Tax=Indibacter alkaliphilus (strain CCUG 57479 / KCTC 22604 / LW1) TaxID=1189612 RepID=S2DIP4_INDAL|nr:hypothetical protein A33Q_1968 [Indibacter alkaliphilus LW1]
MRKLRLWPKRQKERGIWCEAEWGRFFSKILIRRLSPDPNPFCR